LAVRWTAARYWRTGAPCSGPRKPSAASCLRCWRPWLARRCSALAGSRLAWRGGHGRRSLLELRQAQAWPAPEQHGAWSRPDPRILVSPPRMPAIVAPHLARHWGGRGPLLRRRAGPLAHPLQTARSRPALLIGMVHRELCRWCSVISGGQLKRTGTTDDPAPTDV
jgi:hypothetical protein